MHGVHALHLHAVNQSHPQAWAVVSDALECFGQHVYQILATVLAPYKKRLILGGRTCSRYADVLVFGCSVIL